MIHVEEVRRDLDVNDTNQRDTKQYMMLMTASKISGRTSTTFVSVLADNVVVLNGPAPGPAAAAVVQ
jgi:hypothetical protein